MGTWLLPYVGETRKRNRPSEGNRETGRKELREIGRRETGGKVNGESGEK